MKRQAYFIDTSILVNILEIPHMCQNREDVIACFREYLAKKYILILPLATIIETGNHIAQIADGNIRRKKAEKMKEYLLKTIEGEAPWIYNNSEIEKESLCSIEDKFPNAASQSMGIGDLSIIEAYQQYREQNRKYVDAHIWTLDQHLKAYE